MRITENYLVSSMEDLEKLKERSEELIAKTIRWQQTDLAALTEEQKQELTDDAEEFTVIYKLFEHYEKVIGNRLLAGITSMMSKARQEAKKGNPGAIEFNNEFGEDYDRSMDEWNKGFGGLQ